MSLKCDICGGELQMMPGAQRAVCMNCQMTYPVEQLREKFIAQQGGFVQSDVTYNNGGVAQQNPGLNQPPVDANQWGAQSEYTVSTRNLYLRRKLDLFLTKMVLIIDDNRAEELNGQDTETVITVPQGVHKLVIRAVTGTGFIHSQEVIINVGNYDWRGEFGLKRGLIGASLFLKIREIM